jgi:hypothetical protein
MENVEIASRNRFAGELLAVLGEEPFRDPMFDALRAGRMSRTGIKLCSIARDARGQAQICQGRLRALLERRLIFERDDPSAISFHPSALAFIHQPLTLTHTFRLPKMK